MAYKELKLKPGEATSLYDAINQTPAKKAPVKGGKPAAKKPAAKKPAGGKKAGK